MTFYQQLVSHVTQLAFLAVNHLLNALPANKMPRLFPKPWLVDVTLDISGIAHFWLALNAMINARLVKHLLQIVSAAEPTQFCSHLTIPVNV